MTRNDDETDHGEPDRAISRRTAMAGAGGSLVATVGLAGCLGSTDTNDEGNGDEKGTGKGTDDRPADDADKRPADHRRALDVAFSYDADMDMRFTNRLQLDGDPAGGDRANAVHFTSRGEESGDYTATAVDLRNHSFTLGTLRKAEKIQYDYFVGADDDGASDDIFLILETPDDGLVVTYRPNDGPAASEWQTREVYAELEADGWRAVTVDDDLVDVEDERVTTTTELIGEHITELRNASQYANVLDRFGTETQLLGLAIGDGDLLGETVVDHYVDNLRIGDETVTIPAMLTMDVEFTPPRVQPGRGNFTTTLSFANPADREVTLSLEDIDADSVRIAPYSPLAPPVPGTDESDAAVPATRLRNVTGRGADVEFEADQVAGLLEDGRETTVLIYGAFEGEEPYTFLAVGELEQAG
ncbi:hypothetical protein [Natronolimnohabitans innermongolicus]|uniref:Uncharacterized protein n=1 Tax=Natronolimnohabitans innermongolicus JCM 12255 TaxID=1227499 RepID=L9XH40_9EURY|nr:hypothetical protein [Natronolimnohabitans innermongolicus]ELY60932.1 hypothetical protein C493_03447 [Natronolimnohabitans innermongolicus JCM 12255]